jgi:type III secretion protein J
MLALISAGAALPVAGPRVEIQRMRTRAILASLALSACTVDVQHDLSEEDANEIFGVLYERGFNPVKHREDGEALHYAVAVSKPDAARASTLLRKHGLPRTHQPGWAVFADQKMLTTPSEERALLMQALSGEVANILGRIPSVVDTRVIVNVPPTDELLPGTEKAPTTASVFVRYRADSTSTPLGVPEEQLKRFVAGAVPDLKPERVTVVAVASVETADPAPTGELLTADLLKLMVAILSALLLVSAGALVTLVRRHRRSPSISPA